jgi:hypothetical protein
MIDNKPLTYKKIFLFWIPLAATWLMMSAEGPYLAAIIARLANEKYNLAAFGIAYSFGLMLEAPIIMLLSASIAIVKNKYSYEKMLKFTHILNFGITLGMLTLIYPKIFFFLTVNLMGLKTEIAKITHLSTIFLLPWPAAIGYRRFFQGILIKYGKTNKVAIGTIVRLSAMSVTALVLFTSKLHGACIATISLSIGVSCEALATRIMVHGLIKEVKKGHHEESTEKIKFGEIIHFYYPLALTPVIALTAQPLVTFFIGKSNHAIESLAVLPVVSSFIFIFRSLGLSYHEVAVALMGEKFKNYIKIRNFAIFIGLFSFISLTIIIFTPLIHIWLKTISGLTDELADFAILPMKIMAITPVLSVLISFQRAILVLGKQTVYVSIGTMIEVIGIFTVLFTMIKFTLVSGAIAATTSFFLGRLMANVYLSVHCPKVLNKYKKSN